MMISVALVLAMGCGKKGAPTPQGQAAPSQPALPDSTKKTPQPKPKPPPIKPDNVLWEFETGGVVYSSPAIGSDGTVYVGSLDNKLYAINGKSGVKLWEFKTGDEVWALPSIGSDGTVYVGSDDNKLYAINGKSGDKLWEFKTRYYVSSSP
ncbi:MAG: PQQ-binding-like beta-propeller repeat protein, partial [Verrucomicrobiota bacterium]|nr:PQQ-binding-like beta-propeller repeat protein [Verrucomicrobiota bacterium]